MSDFYARKEERFPSNELPEYYRNYLIKRADSTVDIVETTDASLTGYGFRSKLSNNHYRTGSTITLFPLGETLPLTGVVKYAHATKEGTHVGVSICCDECFEAYKELLQDQYLGVEA